MIKLLYILTKKSLSRTERGSHGRLGPHPLNPMVRCHSDLRYNSVKWTNLQSLPKRESTINYFVLTPIPVSFADTVIDKEMTDYSIL